MSQVGKLLGPACDIRQATALWCQVLLQHTSILGWSCGGLAGRGPALRAATRGTVLG